MPSVERLKAKACAEIDRLGDELIGIARTILDNPEPGFREFKTARTVAEAFQRFGIPLQRRHWHHRTQGRPARRD